MERTSWCRSNCSAARRSTDGRGYRRRSRSRSANADMARSTPCSRRWTSAKSTRARVTPRSPTSRSRPDSGRASGVTFSLPTCIARLGERRRWSSYRPSRRCRGPLISPRRGAYEPELRLGARASSDSGMLKLEINSGPGAGRTIDLVGATIIGREGADIAVEGDTEMSRRHACLRVEGGRVLVEDLGSTNGTYVGNQRITSPVWLDSDTELTLGLSRMTVRFAAPLPAPDAAAPTVLRGVDKTV